MYVLQKLEEQFRVDRLRIMTYSERSAQKGDDYNLRVTSGNGPLGEHTSQNAAQLTSRTTVQSARHFRDSPATGHPRSVSLPNRHSGNGTEQEQEQDGCPISVFICGGDSLGFPSLSTSRRFDSMSKRERARRGALQSLDIGETDVTAATTPVTAHEGSHPARTPSVLSSLRTTGVRTQNVISESASAIQHLSSTIQDTHSHRITHLPELSVVPVRNPFANTFNSAKKTFSADSPSFTPAQIQSGAKKSTFSSQTANAAPFTPKGVGNCESKAPFCAAIAIHADQLCSFHASYLSRW